MRCRTACCRFSLYGRCSVKLQLCALKLLSNTSQIGFTAIACAKCKVQGAMCATRASRSIEEPETQYWVCTVVALLLIQLAFCDSRFYVCYQSFYTEQPQCWVCIVVALPQLQLGFAPPVCETEGWAAWGVWSNRTQIIIIVISNYKSYSARA